MDGGAAAIWGAVIGGVIGTVSTPAATALEHHLETKRATELDIICRERLKKLLSSREFIWRSMDMLSSAIGADEEKTAALLIEIEARKSMADGRDNWA